MENNKGNYIAFIDLLGISDLAHSDHDEYNNSLDILKKVVEGYSFPEQGEAKAYLFSDCAYIETKKFETIVGFLSDIRHKLLRQGIFYKGGIARGILEGKKIKTTNIEGYYFGPGVIRVYDAHNQLKGIGINIIDTDNISKDLKNKYLIKSCYLQHTNSRRAITYFDLKYNYTDIIDEIILIILQKMLETYTQSRRTARYYISLFVSIIQSIDFSVEGVKNFQSLFNIINRVNMQAHFGDLLGIEYIYYALLNKALSDQNKSGDEIKKLYNIMFKNKRFLKSLEFVPDHIFSTKNKKAILISLSNHKFKINEQ
jgi:hypothetical protein